MQTSERQTIFLGAVLLGVICLIGYVALFHGNGEAGGQSPYPQQSDLTRVIPFDGQQSYDYLERLCALGPRFSGSPGMAQQQQMLSDHFTQQGGQVSLQRFDVRHPVDGSRVPMANMIVQWHPQRKERILLCAHYDTRPFPDRDRQNPRGTFVGANDGGSGTAVLMELGRHMPQLQGRYGIDFVLFDGEELVYEEDRDDYFLGSEYFARDYVAQPPEHRYHWGVLLDMVGDAHLEIYQEVNSIRWRETRPLVEDIWNTAHSLGVREFIPRVRHEIRDDHLMLHDIAGIPACVLIDFDYPRPGARSYWHTEGDTPDKCSPDSLAKVGWVMLEWLRRQP